MEKSPYLTQTMFRLLIAIILFISALIFLPFLGILFYLYQTVVFVCAQIFRKDLKNHMKMLSSLWACGESISTNPKLNICLYFVFDGHINLEEFRAIFQKRVIEKLDSKGGLLYPELKMYWTTFLNYIFWKEDENFDLNNHLRIYDYGRTNKELDLKLPNGVRVEEDLVKLIGPLLAKPYKKNTSPWEILLVHNFKSKELPKFSKEDTNKECTVLIVRLHHVMADAYSWLNLFVKNLMLNPLNLNVNFPKIKGWQKLIWNTTLPFKLPWDMAGEIVNSFDGGHCWNLWGRNEKLSGKVIANVSKPLDINLVKSVKNNYGVGYNDVLCAVAGGVCQRLMGEVGQVIPNEISCSTPVALEGHPEGLVNHMSWHVFKWPMKKKLTREERLYIISQRLTPSKYSTSSLGYILLAKYCNLLPSSIIKLMRTLPFTVAWTSFPYPLNPPEFKGLNVKLIDLFTSVGPGDGTVGTGMCMVSANGHQRFQVVIDKTYFPSEEIFSRFGQYAEEELQAYLTEKKKTL